VRDSHRDLKPSNILLGDDDVLKVADFGLARPVHRRVHQLSLTRAGLVAGTAEYLPPEAYRRGYEPDVRGDVFALGVILYEMLVGTPPRGAWSPASERLGVDVRVDSILRRALEPDPSRRWSGVAEMVKALDEVLASPPRYSGTPLVSFPVRAADAAWTVLGIFLFLGSISAVLHVRGARVGLPMDLIGDHGRLTGGFQALFALLLASLPLSLWQLVRLRRFRAIPLREALPSPFGLRLGTGRMAAVLVAIGQFVCVAVPVFFVGGLHALTNHNWLKADDPPWIHGLALTRWGGEEMVSPWQWAKPGENFWLRELYGVPGHPLTRELDRIDFEPGWIPAVMVLAALLLLTVIVVTLFRTAATWLLSGRLGHTGLILVSCGLMVALMMAISAGEKRGADQVRRLGFSHSHAEEVFMRRINDHAFSLLEGAGRPNDGFSNDRLQLYAPEVDFRTYGSIPRGEIPLRLAEEARELGVIEIQNPDRGRRWEIEAERFKLLVGGIVVREEGGASMKSSATIMVIDMEGNLAVGGEAEITRERVERIPLYEVETRVATLGEVEEWVSGFLEALRQPAPKLGLSGFFMPYQLDFKEDVDGNMRAQSEHACTVLVSSLQEAPGPMPAGEPRIIGPLSGGRTRVEIPVRDVRTGEVSHWVADLVFHEGSWRCVRFRFGSS